MNEKLEIRVELWGKGTGQWRIQMHIDSLSFTFANGETPLDAVRQAQDRAANFIRGLADIENRLTKGKIETI
jgi:hypothetical protein